jgi:hypothetical protein
MRHASSMAMPTEIDAHSFWLLLRSLETEVIGLFVAMIMQLSERSISGFIAFLVRSVRLPHLDWNGMQHHDEVEYHLETSGIRLSDSFERVHRCRA